MLSMNLRRDFKNKNFESNRRGNPKMTYSASAALTAGALGLIAG